MKVDHPTERLSNACKDLCSRMKEAGVERMPDEIAAALLDMSDHSHELATWNAFQYLSLKRPIGELILETSELGKSMHRDAAAINDRPTWPMLTWSAAITFFAGAAIGFLLAS